MTGSKPTRGKKALAGGQLAAGSMLQMPPEVMWVHLKLPTQRQILGNKVSESMRRLTPGFLSQI